MATKSTEGANEDTGIAKARVRFVLYAARFFS
ncbi:MAG: hypothetical protein K0R17_1767 [Rariglobus sp.]|jgi:hypothetical protein|nr:hypothetical protein [Rariglobus sp.]